MPAKKAAKKAASTAPAKKAAKKTASQPRKTPAGRTAKKSAATPTAPVDLQTAAYLNYRNRLAKGEHGDQLGDWLAAEKSRNPVRPAKSAASDESNR